jgi:peroxin-6
MYDCSGQYTLHLLQAGIALTAADFDVALGKARATYSESIGAPKIPSVSWDDVGGLAHVKADILDTIQLPLDHPELFADGLKKRSGVFRWYAGIGSN